MSDPLSIPHETASTTSADAPVRISTDIQIEPVGELDWDEFFRYINDHRFDNGQAANGYFLPISKFEATRPYPKEDSFRSGLGVPVGSEGWRRAWVARTDRQIVGHVDLRAHPVPFAEHRCLLGMGVHRDHRRRGLGATLLAHAVLWATKNTQLEWIDLDVLTTNDSALRLYRRAGFTEVGEVADMFRIDGQAFNLTRMAKRISSMK